MTPYQITRTLTEGNATLGQFAVNTTAVVRAGFVGNFDISAAGASIMATATTEFTGTGATFTHPVDFGGTADAPLAFQTTFDLGDGMVPSAGIVTLVDFSPPLLLHSARLF